MKNPPDDRELPMFNFRNLPPWQVELIRKYPGIYRDVNPMILPFYGVGETLPTEDKEYFCNLRYGFEFREGWKPLVDHFSRVTTDFVANLRKSGAQPDAWVKACVFEEKKGTLHWFGSKNLIEPYRTVFQGFVVSIEVNSRFICELSGAEGKLRHIAGMLICLSDAKFAEAHASPNILYSNTQHYR